MSDPCDYCKGKERDWTPGCEENKGLTPHKETTMRRSELPIAIRTTDDLEIFLTRSGFTRYRVVVSPGEVVVHLADDMDEELFEYLDRIRPAAVQVKVEYDLKWWECRVDRRQVVNTEAP